MSKPTGGKLITVAIHTYERAIHLKELLEKEGIATTIHNVNLEEPKISSGVRVRIYESDLPLALKVIEDSTIFVNDSSSTNKKYPQKKSNILIPIDFSTSSRKACRIGFEYAHKADSEITLLHSYVSSNFTGSLPFKSDKFTELIHESEEDKELVANLNKKMQEFSREIKEEIETGKLPNVKFNTIVTEGIPEDSILEYAKQLQAQLIIMATRGKGEKDTDLIGSVTAEVLDACQFPVFTVPGNNKLEDINDIKHVIFFSNLCQEDLISFDIFTRLFSNRNISVELITFPDKKTSDISSRNRAILDYCTSNYPNYKFSIKSLEENKLVEILNEGSNGCVDLIIIPNKKKNIFARLFTPSIAHKMFFLIDNTPMLIVPI